MTFYSTNDTHLFDFVVALVKRFNHCMIILLLLIEKSPFSQTHKNPLKQIHNAKKTMTTIIIIMIIYERCNAAYQLQL